MRSAGISPLLMRDIVHYRPSQSVCPSVRSCDTFMYYVEMAKHTSKLFQKY